MSSDTPGLITGSFVVAVFAAGFVHLIYNVQLPAALGVGLVSGIVGYLLLQNREKNLKKWRKNPTTFPSPLGGGIVGEYMKRPWRQELAELGQAYRKKGAKKPRSAKTNKMKSEDG